jgi:hypothetical protein
MSTERNAVQAPCKPRGATVNIFPDDSPSFPIDAYASDMGIVSAFACDSFNHRGTGVEVFAMSPKGSNRISFGLAHIVSGHASTIATSDDYAALAKWSHHNWHVTADRVEAGFGLLRDVAAGWDMVDTSTDESITDELDANECFPAGTVGPMVDDNDDIIELLNAIAF